MNSFLGAFSGAHLQRALPTGEVIKTYSQLIHGSGPSLAELNVQVLFEDFRIPIAIKT